MLVGGEDSFFQCFKLESAKGLKLRAMLAIPIHQRALGDLNGGGDAGETPAFGPELEETALGVNRMHINNHSRATRPVRRPAAQVDRARRLAEL